MFAGTRSQYRKGTLKQTQATSAFDYRHHRSVTYIERKMEICKMQQTIKVSG